MRSVGIRQCILESRPHPDWLGPGWWESLDAIFDEAESLGMRVWVFDDAAFPSGRAGNLMRDRHPELLKVYLARKEIDARGPLVGRSFRIGAWLGQEEALVGVVAARRSDPRGTALEAGTMVDLTEQVDRGLLRWEVPEGWWRLFVLVRTRSGGEEGTRDYLNPLVAEAGRAYVQEVHEAHYRRYAGRFGAAFAGFFSDEPRFGNMPRYDAVLGRVDMVLPWSDNLLEELDARWEGPFRAVLPALWFDAGEISHRARFLFMDVVSRRFSENYSETIGAWCRDHGVSFIGHVVEDNDAHARLGHGAGHFFRALRGQDMSGLDVVYSQWPGFPEGLVSTPFATWDMEFFRWGIAKMASSAAHCDPRKAGRTMCEIFGAYGWQLGLRDMKWLTDHVCSRGVNFLVPHAFSPRFPDPDCPPHFYAGGNNPQWRLFSQWSAYAERLCGLLSGGLHVAPVAVLYHAEAEWAGDCELFQHPVRVLAERQIDCDVVCIDSLLDTKTTRIGKGSFLVNRESFRCLVVPYAQRLPLEFLRFLVRLARAGVRVLFTRGAPAGASDADAEAAADELAALRVEPRVAVMPTADIAEALLGEGFADIRATPDQPHLRTCRYRREGMDLVFCVNEDPRTPVDTRVTVRETRPPVGYDTMTDTVVSLEWENEKDGISVRLRLEPYCSLFIVFADDASTLPKPAAPAPFIGDCAFVSSVDGPWKVSASGASCTGDLSAIPGLEDYAGTVAYETGLLIPKEGHDGLWLDLGVVGESSEAWLDGQPLGVRICPPHRYRLGPLAPGAHRLKIDVTTTLARRLGDNAFDRAMAQDPIGLIGPVRLLRPPKRL